MVNYEALLRAPAAEIARLGGMPPRECPTPTSQTGADLCHYSHSPGPRTATAFLQLPAGSGGAPSEALVAKIAAASEFGAMKRRHEAADGAAGAVLRHAGEAGHFRAGVAGGWRHHFSAAQRTRFAVEMRRRLGGSGLLERFPDWMSG